MLSDGTGGLVGQNEEASTCNNQCHGIGDDGVGWFGAESCAIRETMKNCIRAKNIAVRRAARMPMPIMKHNQQTIHKLIIGNYKRKSTTRSNDQ